MSGNAGVAWTSCKVCAVSASKLSCYQRHSQNVTVPNAQLDGDTTATGHVQQEGTPWFVYALEVLHASPTHDAIPIEAYLRLKA